MNEEFTNEQQASEAQRETEQPAVQQVTEQQAPAAQQETKQKMPKPYLVPTICQITCLAFQALLIVFYLAGAARVFDESINIASVFGMIGTIFSFNKADIYAILVKFAVGIAYFVILIFLIRTLIFTSKQGKYLKNAQKYSPVEQSRIYSRIAKGTFFSFQLIFAYITCCNLAWESSFSGLAIAALVIGAAVYIFTRIAALFIVASKPSVYAIVENGIKSAIRITIVALFYAIMNQPVFKYFIYGMKTLFTGNINFTYGAQFFLYSFYTNILYNAIFFAVVVILLKIIHEFLLFLFYDNIIHFSSVTTKMLVRSMVFLSAALIVHFVFGTLLSWREITFDSEMISVWFSFVRYHFLPVLLLLLAWWTVEKFTQTRMIKATA